MLRAKILSFFAAIILVSTAIGANAAQPTPKQMQTAMETFEELKSFGTPEFTFANGAAQATMSTANGQATLVGYVPAGKSVPNVAVIMSKVPVGKFMSGALDLALEDLSLVDVTAILVPPGNKLDNAKHTDLPKVLKDSVGKVAKGFDLYTGVNLFARVDAKARGVAADALKAIGLTTLKDIVVQAKVGTAKALMLKKTTSWRSPFGLKKVGSNHTTLDGLTLMVQRSGLIDPEKVASFADAGTAQGAAGTAPPPGAKKASGAASKLKNTRFSGWGEMTLNRKKYLFYAQYVTKGKAVVGKAYGIDAKAITLASVADLAAALPWSNKLAAKGLSKLPLGAFKLENPNYKDFDPKGDAPPFFEDMILVAASPKVKLPDKKEVAGTRGLIKGTVGPLIYANGKATIFGETVGNVEARMSIHGLKADADIKARSIGPIKFDAGLDFHLGPKDGKKAYDHEMKMTGKASVHGLGEISLSMYVDLEKVTYHIPASCPLNPSEIKASAPSAAGLALNGIKDFDVSIGLSDCYSEAIIGAIKDPKKLVGITKNLAEGSIQLGKDAAKEIGDKIVNADKTLKDAWKTSIDAGQTAAAAVKNMDKTIKNLGKEIVKIGKAIEDLGNEIKDLAKKIGDFFAGKISKLKKKKSKEKSKKSKLEAKKKRLAKDKKKAAKALGKLSPYFDPKVVDARTEQVALRFEKKLARARETYAKQLKKDLANSSKRKELMKLVNVDAIIKQHVPEYEYELAGGTAKKKKKKKIGKKRSNPNRRQIQREKRRQAKKKRQASAKAKPKQTAKTDVAAVNKKLIEKRALIENQIMGTVFENAMDAHLATVKPDPVAEIPFDTPIRIVGQYKMCLEAFRYAKKGRGWMANMASFLPRKLRIAHCHDKDQKEIGKTEFSTQRFKMTTGGKLLALFDKVTVCFNSKSKKLETMFCQDKAEQVFFADPTITSLRPMVAKKGKEPRCMSRRYAARPGALVHLKPCKYNKKGNAVGTYQTWRIAKWSDKLPKKVKVPRLSSLWKHYGASYGNAVSRADKTAVTLGGLIKLYPRDSGGAIDHGEIIDILPGAQRPDRRLIFTANGHGQPARVDVFANGVVRWVTGNKKHNWVSLGNIQYPLKTGKKLGLAGGCSKHSKMYRDPSYSQSGKTVMLSGLLKCKIGTKARLLATLPKGARPSKRLIFNANAHEASARVDIRKNGRIEWTSGGGKKHGWVSLDGLVFSTAKAKGVKFKKGCKNYGGAYGGAAARLENGVVRLSGLVKCDLGGKARHLLTLPAGYRPKARLIFDAMGTYKSMRVDVHPDGKVEYITGGKLWKISSKWVSLDGIAFAPTGAGKMALKW